MVVDADAFVGAEVCSDGHRCCSVQTDVLYSEILRLEGGRRTKDSWRKCTALEDVRGTRPRQQLRGEYLFLSAGADDCAVLCYQRGVMLMSVFLYSVRIWCWGRVSVLQASGAGCLCCGGRTGTFFLWESVRCSLQFLLLNRDINFSFNNDNDTRGTVSPRMSCDVVTSGHAVMIPTSSQGRETKIHPDGSKRIFPGECHPRLYTQI